MCAGKVGINTNVGKIKVVLVNDNDVGKDIDGITDGIVDGIVDGFADNGIADGIADNAADGKETQLKGKGGRQPSARLIFMADQTAAHFHFLIVDFF